MAGRISGYPQMVLGLGGLGMSVVLGVRFFAWYLVNSSRLRSNQDDPLATLAELWTAVRWPLLGLAVFAVALIWALLTSWQVLREAKAGAPDQKPPRL